MKKKLVASLAAAMVLGVAGTSFAAANPFADVPAKHWAYDAVATLAQAGIVDGYSDGKYQGDKMISRYEMAQMVAKAMARSDKATAAQKAAIDKLSVEFASELEGLNVRVSKIEKNASSVKITGEVRALYHSTNLKANVIPTQNAHSSELRTRLALSGNINEDWSYVGRVANERVTGAGNGANNTTSFDIAYVKGHIGSIETTVGRQEYMPNYGLFLDTAMDGVKFSFGNAVKTNVYYGSNKEIGGVRLETIGADFTYAVTKDTNIVAEIFQLKNTSISNNNKAKLWEVGFDTKLSADWKAKAAYGQVNTDGTPNNDNKAWMVGFDYKGADKTKVGSYGAFVNYRNIGANAEVAPTFDNATVAAGLGGKGFEVGFNYVPMANSVFTTKYIDIKSTPDFFGAKTQQFRAQIEMFF